MQADNKSQTLNIRASSSQKAILAEAARLQNMNVSQFVLTKSINAAEQVIADQKLINVTAAEYDWILNRLEEPPADLPKLRELISKPSVFES
jgi:uncharacterized protein (DUF1778 family)